MKSKSYTVTFTEDEKGKCTINSINDGLTSLEVLGLLQYKLLDVYGQIIGTIDPPQMVRRTVIQEQQEQANDN
jgi:hypothetical protein